MRIKTAGSGVAGMQRVLHLAGRKKTKQLYDSEDDSLFATPRLKPLFPCRKLGLGPRALACRTAAHSSAHVLPCSFCRVRERESLRVTGLLAGSR